MIVTDEEALIQRTILNLHNRILLLEANGLQNTSTFIPGDIAWMLAATALVFMMTLPGLSLYYAGMVPRKQSLLTIAMHAFSITSLVTLGWMFFGYSLAFSPGSPVIGGYKKFFLVNLDAFASHPRAPTIPEPLFCAFQLGFAVLSATLMIGAAGDRMKFYSIMVIVLLWHFCVYCPIVHSNWHSEGFLYDAGVLDYAGGNVVHVCAGLSGLMSSFVVGKRYGFDEDKFTPNNMLHTITGACLLWIGWFGFNAGSSYGADEQAAMAILMTLVGTSAATFSWILTEYAATRVPTVLGMVNGAIAGLISMTPAAGYVDSTGAIFIGLLSGPVCYYGIRLKGRFGFDDYLDAFGLHGIAGMYGGFMTGLFAKNFGGVGAFYGNPKQIGIQVYGIVISAAWSLLMTFLILWVVEFTIGVRIAVDTERSGLDRSLHGEGLYAARQKTTTPTQRVAELFEAYAEAKAKAAEDERVSPLRGRHRPSRDGPVSEDSSLTTSFLDAGAIVQRRAALAARLHKAPGGKEYATTMVPSSDENDEKVSVDCRQTKPPLFLSRMAHQEIAFSDDPSDAKNGRYADEDIDDDDDDNDDADFESACDAVVVDEIPPDSARNRGDYKHPPPDHALPLPVRATSAGEEMPPVPSPSFLPTTLPLPLHHGPQEEEAL